MLLIADLPLLGRTVRLHVSMAKQTTPLFHEANAIKPVTIVTVKHVKYDSS
jgi:hypothetical protein